MTNINALAEKIESVFEAVPQIKEMTIRFGHTEPSSADLPTEPYFGVEVDRKYNDLRKVLAKTIEAAYLESSIIMKADLGYEDGSVGYKAVKPEYENLNNITFKPNEVLSILSSYANNQSTVSFAKQLAELKTTKLKF